MMREDYCKLKNTKREARRIEREQFADPGYSTETGNLETNVSILQPYKLVKQTIKFVN